MLMLIIILAAMLFSCGGCSSEAPKASEEIVVKGIEVEEIEVEEIEVEDIIVEGIKSR